MKYYIDYIDKSGDLAHVHVSAYSETEAIELAKAEYWDIDQIKDVRRATL